ncbi:MAG: sporulation protein Cse60 [Bacteroidales bacterium]|nr:sporulation protein Cse60 [Bacteroidales bacterium]
MGWGELVKRDLTDASADDVREEKVESEVTQIEKTNKSVTRVKLFQRVTLKALESDVNKFLETIDSSDIKNISFASREDDNTVMVVYETKE